MLRHRADAVSAHGQSLFRVSVVRLGAILQRASAPASVARWAHPALRCILHLLLAAKVLQAGEKIVVDTREEEAARRPSESDIRARAEKEKDIKAPFSKALMCVLGEVNELCYLGGGELIFTFSSCWTLAASECFSLAATSRSVFTWFCSHALILQSGQS